MSQDDYSIFDLMDDMDRLAKRQEAERKIAQMPDFEKFFVLGLLRHEEQAHGQAGIESVLAWIANRED